jgi:prolyl 4-hydroxylase
MSVLQKIIRKVRRYSGAFYERRYFLLHKITGAGIPQHNLSYMPDGFSITKVGNTGVSVIDGFCTPEEAQAIIDLARDQLKPSAVQIDGKFVLAEGRNSETALVFGPKRRDPELLPFACRAAALTGLPYTHLEGVYVTRYGEGGRYDEHLDCGSNFKVDRLYTVLLYLNDMELEHGGSTAFPNLNIEVQPRVGRAVSWTNMNPDGSIHNEASHAALPVKSGGEKWSIQFWFHPYKMFDEIKGIPPQAAPGVPLGAQDELPDGASLFSDHKL